MNNPKLNKILIVDDEAILLEDIKQSLNAIAKNILISSSGQEAIEVIKKHNDIELVITDFSMDNGDGGELISFIIGNEYSQFGNHIPIILITGYLNISEKIGLERASCFQVILKPFKMGVLIKKVKEMILDSELQLTRCALSRIEEKFNDMRERLQIRKHFL